VVDNFYKPIRLPPEGLVLNSALAEILAVEPGDTVTVEVLEGRRPMVQIRVSGAVDQYIGTNAYMELGALRRMMDEGDTVSGVYLQTDPSFSDPLYQTLKDTPAVAGVMRTSAAIESFNDTFAELINTVRQVTVFFAVIIAFGVVYNSARISLAERSRELATLRVIGFTRAEISYILLGELTLLTLIAVPLGLLLGYAMSAVMIANINTEMFRLPLVISSRSMAFSAITITVATVFSALIVRRKLDRLSLVEVLKSRE
jgi:putative ABC transport system permease protein